MMGYTQKFLDWQVDQMGCNCAIHRYRVAHLCVCGEVVAHSQAEWDHHKFHGGMLNFDTFWYKHDDRLSDVMDRYIGYGFHMPWIECNREVYDKLVELMDETRRLK